MNALERKAILAIGSLMALRMLGLFMLIPVLPILGLELSGASSLLIGLLVGIYGLTQALFQLPFGWLSDRWGRKPVILLGLCFFILGGLVAYASDHIYGVILGRGLQGAGAIASALMALLADSSREEQRSKLMALVGISIGASFMLAIVMGPVLTQWFDLSQLFLLTAVAGLLGIVLVYTVFPETKDLPFGTHSLLPAQFWDSAVACLKSSHIILLMGSVALLHALMTTMFILFPTWLDQQLAWPVTRHWRVYLPLILVTCLTVFPLLGLVEKNKQHRSLLFIGFVCLGFGVVSFKFVEYLTALTSVLMFVAFFLAFLSFSILEATLPALMSRLAPKHIKGTALGLFSTAQFLGAFLGSFMMGLAMEFKHMSIYLLILSALCIGWGGVLAVRFKAFHQ